MGSAVKNVAGKMGGAGQILTGGMAGGAKPSDISRSALDKTAYSQKLAGTGAQQKLANQQAQGNKALQAQASGKAPSIAEAQMKATTNRSLAQQLAAAQSSRGGSAASRERTLAKSQGTARREVAESSSAAKLAEQQAAQKQLATNLASQRASEIGLAQADRTSLQGYEQLKVKQDLAIAGLNASADAQASAEQGQFLTRGLGISDKNCKTNIKKEGSSKKALAKSISDEDCKTDIKEEDTDTKEEGKSEVEMPEAPDTSKHIDKGIDTGKAVDGAISGAMSGASKGGVYGAVVGAAVGAGKSIVKDKMKGKMPAVVEKVGKVAEKVYDAKKGNVGSMVKSKGKSMLMSKISESMNKKSTGSGGGAGKQLHQQMLSETSDENCKENIKTKEEDFNPKSFLDKLQAYSYDYKKQYQGEEGGGEGRYLSVMAQDLEKAGPVGKSMVVEHNGHKAVDYGKGLATMLANQAHLNERLNEVESGYGKVLEAKAERNHKKRK